MNNQSNNQRTDVINSNHQNNKYIPTTFYPLSDNEEDLYHVAPHQSKIDYDFYDEMNDLDALYKELHCNSNQMDIFINILLAILRPIFIFFILFLTAIAVVHIIGNQTVYGQHLFKSINIFFSNSFFLQNLNNNNNNHFLSS